MALRYDTTGTITRVEKTPQGGLLIPAFLTRSGVFEYKTRTGVIREYRPPEEVFNPESMASLANAPVTFGHPPQSASNPMGHVTPETFREYVRGNVVGGVTRDGDKLAGNLAIQDREAALAVLTTDAKELSCGYRCDFDNTPGTSPEGQPYDRVQRNVRYNHVAIVSDGRAGSEIGFRLDSNDNQIVNDSEKDPTMTPEQMAKAIQDAITAALAPVVERLTKLEAGEKGEPDPATAVADADAAKKDAEDAKAKLAAATDPKAEEARADARANLLIEARAVLGASYETAGKSADQIRIDVIQKREPGFRADGKSSDFILGVYEAKKTSTGGAASTRRAAVIASGGGGDNANSGVRADSKDEDKSARGARDRMVERNRAAASAPLAASKK